LTLQVNYLALLFISSLNLDEELDRYTREFRLLFDDDELEEAERRFRLAAISGSSASISGMNTSSRHDSADLEELTDNLSVHSEDTFEAPGAGNKN
jgi:hypothetical protein